MHQPNAMPTPDGPKMKLNNAVKSHEKAATKLDNKVSLSMLIALKKIAVPYMNTNCKGV
jgi:hypothetical protein